MSVLAFKLRQGCTGQLLGLLLQMVRGFAGHAQLLERFVQSGGLRAAAMKPVAAHAQLLKTFAQSGRALQMLKACSSSNWSRVLGCVTPP